MRSWPLPPRGALRRPELRAHGVAAVYDASRANDGIPSLRHRAKTAPRKQSIRFPCCTLFITQHDRSGENRCLSTFDHFGHSILGRACKHRERICAVIWGQLTLPLFRADIYPISTDAIVVEVAWPGCYHRSCRR